MKITMVLAPIALLASAFTPLAVPTWAATAKEVDYPVQYEVMNASKVGGWLIGTFCTMSLRDQARAGAAFIVQRINFASCHVWDSGAIISGHNPKNMRQSSS